jgi:hypothetical protein
LFRGRPPQAGQARAGVFFPVVDELLGRLLAGPARELLAPLDGRRRAAFQHPPVGGGGGGRFQFLGQGQGLLDEQPLQRGRDRQGDRFRGTGRKAHP